MNLENTTVSQEEQAVSGQPSAVSGIAGEYQPYPEYKESGVDWIESIPTTWGLKRVKHLFTIRKRVAGELGYDILSITQRGIKVKDIETGEGQLSMDYSKYQQVRPGDFAMNHMDLLTGYVDISQYVGVTSPDYRVFTVDDERNDSRFFLYLFQMGYQQRIFFHMGQGASHLGRWRLATDEFNNLIFPLPSTDEQRTIAAFLDHETARIDALIAKQQRLIALLKEKRQAVISHAVTKGLPSINGRDAPMKDSGVEWLGQVPEHWETSRIGWLCSVGNGMTPNRSNPDYWIDGDQPWLNSSKVNDREVVQADQFVTIKAVAECSLPKVSADSIIMAITGEGKTRGTSAIIRIETTINQHIAYMTPSNSRLSPEFLLAWLESQYERIRFESEGWGSTKAAITCSDIKGYPLPLPPYAEQGKICDYLVAQHRKFNNLTEKAKAATQLLQERRTALISAAVTGKVDLRDWKAPDAG